MAENTTVKEERKVSKEALAKSFRNWYYGNLTCFSQEHMQTFGYLVSMLPIVEDLYDKKEDQNRALQTYSAFFNTEPQIGSMIVGVTVGLEEARANGQPVTDDTINGIRAGLMGPLAGIGDSLIVGTLIPILLGISMGLSQGGSVLGPIFYIVVWNLLAYFGMRFAYYRGYKLGGDAVEALVGPNAQALREAIVMIGTIVIGAVDATWVSITTALQLPGGGTLQGTLDGIYPKLLPLIFTIFCWWLMSKKKVSPIITMLILLAIAFVGALCGFFGAATIATVA
ncbi:MAG: PTS system mannose/fructose/sorbose family transporter subunit IID [Olsenella sp.]|jgi:flagellin-like protein|nr:PTS system mannose/fructose/sorbose family transporter subunit IID [Olsenella sp.]MCH3956877.1 PTS system mannose/fructose/sorbose family transporter subunit IID [Olsenella sp.]MCI1646132.1 PTS system mannose/fructose/sorbose family transporter subunit IID [Olsenella sp.]MCI1793732.1 PTS system mannose/fructose/sorbose family transporter subunit IID [Olsenella sp.]MCI2123655.1 PTS system mannose/fructose/sorbose family transporter subunit IID [Olsenella sp.]